MNRGVSIVQSQVDKFHRLLAQPVNGASLALFRVFFGTVMFFQVAKYLWPDNGTTRLEFLYDQPALNFTYPGLSWVQPFPEPFWTLFFCVIALAGAFVAAGFLYRYAAVVLAAGYSVLLASSFPITQKFGVGMLLTVTGALIGDVLVLPACLVIFKPYRVQNEEAGCGQDRDRADGSSAM